MHAGGVKIGQFQMQEGQRRPTIPDEFDELGEEFFSLGQDDSYYENSTSWGRSFEIKFSAACAT